MFPIILSCKVGTNLDLNFSICQFLDVTKFRDWLRFQKASILLHTLLYDIKKKRPIQVEFEGKSEFGQFRQYTMRKNRNSGIFDSEG